MKLRFLPFYLEAGKPIAFVSEELAKQININERTKIEIIHEGIKLILPVNIVRNTLKANEISFSDEAVKLLKLRKGSVVDLFLASEPESTKYIMKKFMKRELTREEMFSIVRDIVQNALNEAEIAYFVSAVHYNGLSIKETIYLTEAIAKSGKILSWRNKIIADKHSIGGIPGNRTTPIVVSICAAAGLTIPKTSSRAITSAAGTADVMETITNVNLTPEKLKRVTLKTNGCLVWGGAIGLAPADDKLIRVERLLNLDPEAQLLASIIAKKLAVGSNYVLIDIPYGKYAKVSFEQAKLLKEKFVKICKHFNINVRVVLTDGTKLLASGVGPMFEMNEVLKVLNRKNSPAGLEKKSILLSSELLEMTGKVKKGEGEKVATDILNSKMALSKFNEIIKEQGRKKFEFKPAKFSYDVRAKRNFKIREINMRALNLLAITLGCPISKNSGVYFYKGSDESVKKGEKIFAIYSDLEKKLKDGIKILKKEKIVS